MMTQYIDNNPEIKLEDDYKIKKDILYLSDVVGQYIYGYATNEPKKRIMYLYRNAENAGLV